MAKRTVFSDDNNNELDCYINSEGKVFISVGDTSNADDLLNNGYITLDKKDVGDLVNILQELYTQMPD